MGLAAAAPARILGRDGTNRRYNGDRLTHAKSVGFEPIDLTTSDSLEDLIEAVLREVDAAIDAVGFEGRGHGLEHANEAPATVLNSLKTITCAAGGSAFQACTSPRILVPKNKAAQQGSLSMRFASGWAKSHSFFTGQTSISKYNRGLMQAILHDRLAIARIVNATVIPLEKAPEATVTSILASQRNSCWIRTGCLTKHLDSKLCHARLIRLLCRRKGRVGYTAQGVCAFET